MIAQQNFYQYPNLKKPKPKKYLPQRHKNTKDELRGFAPIGMMELWNDGINRLPLKIL